MRSGNFWYQILPDDTAEITGFSGRDSHVSIPAELDGVPVTVIGKNAFSDHHKMKSVTLPEGIKEIGECGFQCCVRLEKVSLPQSLRSIGKNAFD